MVLYAWRLYRYVSDEMRTHTCGSGSGVAAAAIAVPMLVSIASRSAQMLRETETYMCMPYVWNSSQGVENGTLDLVLSLFTHTNAVQTIAIASKGWWLFLQYSRTPY